jgi:hypothetical protein
MPAKWDNFYEKNTSTEVSSIVNLKQFRHQKVSEGDSSETNTITIWLTLQPSWRNPVQRRVIGSFEVKTLRSRSNCMIVNWMRSQLRTLFSGEKCCWWWWPILFRQISHIETFLSPIGAEYFLEKKPHPFLVVNYRILSIRGYQLSWAHVPKGKKLFASSESLAHEYNCA